MEMEKERRPPFRSERQEGRGQVEGDAVEMDAEELAQADVAKAHQRERSQEVLAILAIGRPGLPFDGPAQGQGVDEDRAATQELDVVGAGVGQGQAAAQGPLLDLERGQGGVLKLAEAPLEGVGDEGDLFRPDDLVDVPAPVSLEGDLLVRHE